MTVLRRVGSLRAVGALLAIAIVLELCSGLVSSRAAAAGSPKAAPPPWTIAVFVSSRRDLCFDPGDVGAITRLVRREEERINRRGGLHGRSVQLRLFDDQGDPARTTANLRTAIADPQMLAMIGISNSNRAKTALDATGSELVKSAIPFVSNISVAALFKDLPNVLSTQVSQDEARVPVMAEFIRALHKSRIAYIGVSDAVFSAALGDGLAKRLPVGDLIADHRLRLVNDALIPAEVAAVVADIKAKSPDLVVLGTGARRAGDVVAALVAEGVTPALFHSGRIDALPEKLALSYPNAQYELAWNRLPDADNDRLRRLISRDPPEDWMFEGRKVAETPGWKAGQCQPRSEGAPPDPLATANQRAIGLGAQFADMVALTAEAARTAAVGSDILALRRHVLKQLTTTYAAGRGIFKGSFETWSFDPASRTAMRTPFVVILPQSLGHAQLAPVQFVRTKDGTLRRMETVYLDIDLVRAHRVDDNEKTFFGEFYLSMRDNTGAGIERIEFTNAYLDPKTNGRQITIEALHTGGPSATYPEAMKVYKVTGRFTFEPELSRYPFDTQRFAIEIQPKRADQPFVVQTPPLELRDKTVASDGWDLKAQYVGYGEDVVPLLDAYTLEPSVVPFYRASFVWMMKRQTTDYFLRVVVPLGFILVVAYFSYFITTAHFEAIVTIQVTALLSAVALYLSLPKLDSDDATLSDRLFVFNYMMVSLMIGISILRVSAWGSGRRWLKGVLRVLHVVGIPALVVAMALYVQSVTEL